jgi:hypothetical protein
MASRVITLPRLAVVVVVALSGLLFSTDANASNWVTGITSGRGLAQSTSAPGAPAAVTASCVSATQKLIKVTWSSVAHASYDVYQATAAASGPYTLVSSGQAASSYTTATLANGNYWYEIAASVGTNWTSAKSAASAQRTIKSGATTCS